MAALMKRFVKPPLTRLLKNIPSEVLDKPLTDKELSIIAQLMLEWQVKAVSFGVEESEIESIREDHKNSNEMQKLTMMRRWREKCGDQATLRELIMISRRKGWNKFIHKVCQELGHLKEGN